MINSKISLILSPIFNPIFNQVFIFFAAFAFFMPGTVCHVSAETIPVVAIMAKSEIIKDTILLGKIAKISGKNQQFVEKLKAVVIGKSPLPGKLRLINEDYIKIRLKQSNVDLSQIILRFPEKIAVLRSFIEVSESEIKKIASDYIYNNIWEKNKVKINNIRLSKKKILLPLGKITYQVRPFKNRNIKTPVILPIHIIINGHVEKKITATVNVTVLTEVVVTKIPLGRYRLITKDDVFMQKKNLAKLPSNIIINIKDVLGKRARRTINAGVVLKTDMIENPPLVGRGDNVIIIAESCGLKITAIGEVREKGCRGDRVKVLNTGSNNEIYARVLDANTVRVDF